MASSEILEIPTYLNEKPFFQKTRKGVLVFNITFAADEDWISTSTFSDIVYWLGSPKIHKELYFSDDTTKKYFALYEGSPRIFHNGSRGYVELIFRTNSPYAFSDLIEKDV